MSWMENRNLAFRTNLSTPLQLLRTFCIVTTMSIMSGCAASTVQNRPETMTNNGATSNLDTGTDTDIAGERGAVVRSSSSVMIVRSSGPSASTYPAGKKFSENAKITLKKDDQVTILEKSGTRVLKGPGTFSLSTSSGGRSNSSRIAGFISNRGSSRARTGAVRGAGSSAERKESSDLGEVKVIRGSRSALKRFKLKSTILTGTKICLKRKESLTVLRKKGGVLDLKGPGCNVFRSTGEVVNVAGVSAGS